MFQKNKKKFLLKILMSGGIVSSIFFVMVMVCVLMILEFFGVEITIDPQESYESNLKYADKYIEVLNNNLIYGYVPLSRMLYFYNENNQLSFDELYKLNLDYDSKKVKDIEDVCTEEKLKNMIVCQPENIVQNSKKLNATLQLFNFPLQNSNYRVTSFFNQEREVYGSTDVHKGWDFAIVAKTPVYSSCKGSVYKIVNTQFENTPYNISGNKTGNMITLKCDGDYNEVYYILYAHLYPNSIRVKVGDSVDHWMPIAEVGTTGYSTGDHNHFQVYDKNWKPIDGMQLVNLNYDFN